MNDMYIMFKLGKIRFYITDMRLRTRQNRDNHSKEDRKRWYNEVKKALVDERGSRCEFCGSSDELRSHHVLPYNEFPDLEFEKRNIMLLCDRCHRAVHRNPFIQADMIKQKASELGIDYRSVYDNLHTEKGFKKAKFLFAKLVLKG